MATSNTAIDGMLTKRKDYTYSTENWLAWAKEHKRNNKALMDNPEVLFCKSGFHVRGFGRSTLCAFSILDQAIATPGRWIAYDDHFSSERKFILPTREKVMALLMWDEEYSKYSRLVQENAEKSAICYYPWLQNTPECK